MKRYVVSLLTISFFVLGFALSAAAQDMPKPGPEHKALDYWVGKWKFEGTMEAGPMGPGGKVESTSNCILFEEGFAVVCNSEGKSPTGDATKGIGILSYDADKKAYTYYGVETGSPPAQAAGKKNGDTWVYHGEGGGMKTRVTIKVLSPESYTFTFEASQDGTNWTKVMEGKGTKTGTT